MTGIKGCYPALVTPMKEDGNRLMHEVNEEVYKQLIDYVIEGGVDGIVVAGCTGHACTLTIDEQVRLAELALEHAGKRIRVIVGDGSNCTREAIEFTKKMDDIGIETHLSIGPYQNKPTQEGLYQHYKAIAESSDSDIIVYNVPGRTGKNIEPETDIRLGKEFNNIIGIKEASGDIEQIRKIIEMSKDLDFDVISGDDGLTHEIIKSGGTGCITVAGNVDPKRTSLAINLALEGKFEEAKKVDDEIRELYDALFIETNPMPAHYMLRKLRIPVGVPRLPLVDVTQETAEKIDTVMAKIGLV